MKHIKKTANQLLAEVASAEALREIENSNSFGIDLFWRLATAQITGEFNRLAWQKIYLGGSRFLSTIGVYVHGRFASDYLF